MLFLCEGESSVIHGQVVAAFVRDTQDSGACARQASGMCKAKVQNKMLSFVALTPVTDYLLKTRRSI